MTNQLPPHGSSFGAPRQMAGVASPAGMAAPMSNGAAAGAEEEGGLKITPAFVMRAVRRWWKIATPVAVVLATCAGAYMWVSHKDVYTATAWLRIEDQKPYVAYRLDNRSKESFVDTQQQLIRSPLVLERVVAQPDIARYPLLQEVISPVNALAARLQSRRLGRSELFILSFRWPHTKQASRIVNAVIESYFTVQTQDESARTQRVLELLQDETARRELKVEQLQDNIRELTRVVKEHDPFRDSGKFLSDGETFRHPIESLYNQIISNELEREIAEANLRYEEEASKRIKLADGVVEQAIENDEEVVRLKEQIERLLTRMDQVEEFSSKGKEDPRYLSLLELVEPASKALNEYREELREPIAERLLRRAKRSTLGKQTELNHKIRELKLKEQVLREKFIVQLQDKHEGDVAKLDVSFQQAELRREQRVLTLITERIARMRTETRAPARVTMLRPADPPRGPSNRRNIKKLSVMALAAFLIPFGLAVVWEKIVGRVDGPQQLWQADLTVIGEVARLPVSSRVTSLTSSRAVARDISLFEESIDSLRTCLVLSEPVAESRVLVVSSAVSGEGKTSVASQLAVSIARSSGEPTLLIDADMRSPDLHNVFDIPNEPGLAQVLSHECTAEEAIVTSWSNYVHLLPAGVLKASPHKLLGDGALKLLLNEIRATYRHVVIDTSPILSASESLVLAKAADATLLCAMRDISRIDQVQKAFERLINTGARPLGTVLNGVPTSRYAYLYGTYAYPRDV